MMRTVQSHSKHAPTPCVFKGAARQPRSRTVAKAMSIAPLAQEAARSRSAMTAFARCWNLLAAVNSMQTAPLPGRAMWSRAYWVSVPSPARCLVAVLALPTVHFLRDHASNALVWLGNAWPRWSLGVAPPDLNAPLPRHLVPRCGATPGYVARPRYLAAARPMRSVRGAAHRARSPAV